jgi:hypothetical protein
MRITIFTFSRNFVYSQLDSMSLRQFKGKKRPWEVWFEGTVSKRLAEGGQRKAAERYWRLKPACAAHMLALFKYHVQMHGALGTNPVSWRALTAGNGVTKPTIVRLLNSFFDTLDMQASNNFNVPAGMYRIHAQRFYRIYAQQMLEPNYDDLIEEVVRSN